MTRKTAGASSRDQSRFEHDSPRAEDALREFVVFFVENLACALDIVEAQEIKSQLSVVEVPESDITVRGVTNLRGQVITVLDLRVIFGIEPKSIDRRSRVVISRTRHGVVGLLVDSVDDIIIARRSELQPPPANISGVRGEFFTAVYRRDGDLVSLLNLDKVLAATRDRT